MNFRNKVIGLLLALIISTVPTTQGLVPVIVAEAAGTEIKIPETTVKEKTLYLGDENYKIRFKNLDKNAKVSYQSNNQKVASVNQQGVIKPVSAGTTSVIVTMKQNNTTYTSTIKVMVEWPYVAITDYQYKMEVGQSYEFKITAYGLSKAVFTWSSTNPKVATVNKATGMVKAISVGTTDIIVINSETGSRSTATIFVEKPYVYTPPKGSEKAVYLSGLDLSKKKGTYYTTTKEEYIETTRFVLYLDEGIEIPVNAIDLINHVMDRIEKTTGYKFYVSPHDKVAYWGMNYELDKYFETADKLKKINPEHQRVEIVVGNHDQAVDAYASGVSGILLAPEHIKILDENGYVIIHELLHIAWQRNGDYLGSVLAEGFAEYYSTNILANDKVLTGTYSSYENLRGYDNIINEKTIENLFINYTAGSSRYAFGLRMTCFLIENYGIKDYKKMHDKVTKLFTDSGEVPMDLVAEVIKSEISTDFYQEFVTWYVENLDRFGDKDMSKIGDWYIENGTLNKYYGDDKDVVIPDTVTYINGEVFMDCTTIETVKIPEQVTVIASGVFFDCSSLKEIVIPDNVTFLGYNVFEGCASLKKVVLSKGLTAIKIRAFMDCTSLTDIVLPEGLTSIEANAFSGCSALKTIKLPNTLTSIGATVFSECRSLESIDIPENITDLPEYMFSECVKLKSVTLPKNLINISNGIFRGCESLKVIDIPDNITSIGEAAFNHSGLISVEIPGKVTEIGDYAFSYSKDLKKIIIPKSVNSIGKDVFEGCTELTIYGKTGSYAETYAKDNNIKFMAIK